MKKLILTATVLILAGLAPLPSSAQSLPIVCDGAYQIVDGQCVPSEPTLFVKPPRPPFVVWLKAFLKNHRCNSWHAR